MDYILRRLPGVFLQILSHLHCMADLKNVLQSSQFIRTKYRGQGLEQFWKLHWPKEPWNVIVVYSFSTSDGVKTGDKFEKDSDYDVLPIIQDWSGEMEISLPVERSHIFFDLKRGQTARILLPTIQCARNDGPKGGARNDVPHYIQCGKCIFKSSRTWIDCHLYNLCRHHRSTDGLFSLSCRYERLTNDYRIRLHETRLLSEPIRSTSPEEKIRKLWVDTIRRRIKPKYQKIIYARLRDPVFCFGMDRWKDRIFFFDILPRLGYNLPCISFAPSSRMKADLDEPDNFGPEGWDWYVPRAHWREDFLNFQHLFRDWEGFNREISEKYPPHHFTLEKQ